MIFEYHTSVNKCLCLSFNWQMTVTAWQNFLLCIELWSALEQLICVLGCNWCMWPACVVPGPGTLLWQVSNTRDSSRLSPDQMVTVIFKPILRKTTLTAVSMNQWLISAMFYSQLKSFKFVRNVRLVNNYKIKRQMLHS